MARSIIHTYFEYWNTFKQGLVKSKFLVSHITIVEVNQFDKEAVESLVTAIREEKILTERGWLLEQII